MTVRSILITGASRGIGRVIADHFANELEVVIVTARSEEALQEIAANRRGTIVPVVCDLTSPQQRRNLQSTILELDYPVDGFIHCAGDGLPSLFEHIDSADLRRLFELHVVAPFELAQALLPGMRRATYGRIIAVSSLAAIRPRRFMTSYAATKAALRVMIQCLADEVASFGITANIVTPGSVDTALGRRGRAILDSLSTKPEGSEDRARIEGLPTGRLLEPRDILGTIELLLGPASQALSGQELVVAGTTVMR